MEPQLSNDFQVEQFRFRAKYLSKKCLRDRTKFSEFEHSCQADENWMRMNDCRDNPNTAEWLPRQSEYGRMTAETIRIRPNDCRGNPNTAEWLSRQSEYGRMTAEGIRIRPNDCRGNPNTAEWLPRESEYSRMTAEGIQIRPNDCGGNPNTAEWLPRESEYGRMTAEGIQIRQNDCGGNPNTAEWLPRLSEYGRMTAESIQLLLLLLLHRHVPHHVLNVFIHVALRLKCQSDLWNNLHRDEKKKWRIHKTLFWFANTKVYYLLHYLVVVVEKREIAFENVFGPVSQTKRNKMSWEER